MRAVLTSRLRNALTRGMALATAMMAVTVLLVLGVAYLGTVERDLHFATEQSRQTQAYYLALYGLERFKLIPVNGAYPYGPGSVDVKAVPAPAGPATAVTTQQSGGTTWLHTVEPGPYSWVSENILVDVPVTGGQTATSASAGGVIVSTGIVYDFRTCRMLARRVVMAPYSALTTGGSQTGTAVTDPATPATGGGGTQPATGGSGGQPPSTGGAPDPAPPGGGGGGGPPRPIHMR